MQIWNMKMKMGVIKVIYEAPQSHLWRRHESLVSFMCERLSFFWQASLPELGRGHSTSGDEGGNAAARDCWVLYQQKLCRSQKRKACSVSVMIPFNTRKKAETCLFFFLNYRHAWNLYFYRNHQKFRSVLKQHFCCLCCLVILWNYINVRSWVESNEMNNKPATWCRVFLQKFTWTQLVRNYLPSWNLELHYRVHESSLLTLSWTSWI